MNKLNIYLDKDIDKDLIKNKKIAIIGFGSQGYGQGLNLIDSGCDVVFGLRLGGKSDIKAKDYGLKTMKISDAVKWADIIQILIPDEIQAKVYKEEIEPYIMARIVDFEEFIKKYPFQEKLPENKLTFRIEDPLLEWNNGHFSITWDENENLILTKDIISKPIKLNIGTLTAMLLSYNRPSYLSRVEKMETDSKTIKLLESLIPLDQVYFSDYF